jgi:hypothetical protein
MLALSTFALVAVLLALVGVHGVLSHRVRERTREIGVNRARGDPRRRSVEANGGGGRPERPPAPIAWEQFLSIGGRRRPRGRRWQASRPS